MSESDVSQEEIVVSEHKDWLVCHRCGQVQSVVSISPKHEMRCFNCEGMLHAGEGAWLDRSIALTLTAAVLFIICLFFPILTLEIGGQSQTVTIADGLFALLERDNFVLAALIFTTLFLFPAFDIAALGYLLIPYKLNLRLRGQASVLRWFNQAQGWNMLEVFLLSLVVASIKMADMALLSLEFGSYALFALVGILIFINLRLDRLKLWSWINTNNYFTHVMGERVIDCGHCHAMVGTSILEEDGHCPRCGSEVHERIPHSLQKTTALTLAAAILYIPANVLPIMTYSTLGDVSTDTIMSGVIGLVSAGLYGIAAIVFLSLIHISEHTRPY